MKGDEGIRFRRAKGARFLLIPLSPRIPLSPFLFSALFAVPSAFSALNLLPHAAVDSGGWLDSGSKPD